MGFLDGLLTTLGGFSDVKQIDKEGFDFREKRKSAQEARDELTRTYAQKAEDDATKALAEASIGAPEGTDISSLIPSQVADAQTRARIAARVPGAAAQTKSALAQTKAYTDTILQNVKGQQRLDQIGLTGEQAKDRDYLKFKRTQERGLSPAEQQKLDVYERVASAHDKTSLERGARSGTGKPSYTPATTNETGEAGRWAIYPDGQREWLPAAPTTGMRDTSGMAAGIEKSLQDMKAAAERGVTSGPIAGRLSQWWQAIEPSGDEGIFDSAANKLVDIVYLKSGKQINANEMKLLTRLIPNRSRGNVDFQIQQFEDYADQLLSKYQQQHVTPPGGANRPAGGMSHGPAVKQRRLPNGKTQKRDANGVVWEE
jgi:hypothetical protein